MSCWLLNTLQDSVMVLFGHHFYPNEFMLLVLQQLFHICSSLKLRGFFRK